MAAARALAHLLTAWFVGTLILAGGLCFVVTLAAFIGRSMANAIDPKAGAFMDQLIQQAPGAPLSVNAIIAATVAFVLWGVYRLGANEMESWPDEPNEPNEPNEPSGRSQSASRGASARSRTPTPTPGANDAGRQ